MALQLTTISPSGEVVTDAVHRVSDVCVAFNKHVRFLLNSYATAEEVNPFEVHTLNAPYDATNEDLEQQAYAYVKSLSNFAEATEI